MRGVIEAFHAADGFGRVRLEDGRVLNFGTAALRGFGHEPPTEGMAVVVEQIETWLGGRERAAAVRLEVSASSAWADVGARLLPVLLRAGDADSAVTMPSPFEDLTATLVDHRGFPGARAQHHPVTALDLAKWGVTLEEAMQSALQNLRALPAWAPQALSPGTYDLVAPDGLAAARLLLDDPLAGLWTSGLPVVIVAHQEHVLVTGTDDVAGLATVYGRAQAYLLGSGAGGVVYRVVQEDGTLDDALDPDALSGRAWVRMSDRWFPFAPPPGHPAADALASIEALGRGQP